MKKLIVVVAVIVGAFLVSRQWLLSTFPNKRPPEEIAKVRFEQFMKSWKAGGVSENDAAQAAACLWGRGKYFANVDTEDLKNVVSSFDKWRQAKNVYVMEINYEIGEYKREGDHTVVEVTINGTKHHIGIPDTANPMFWVE